MGVARPVAPRLWAQVERTDSCWLWTGYRTWNGYGWMSVNNRAVAVHRIAYELLVGPIPAGLDLDHVRDRGCTNRNCVNPAHLEPVTRSENLRRGRGVEVLRARAAKITHCPRGHAYAEHAYVTPSGGRTCKICQRARDRAWRAARAGANP